MPRKPRLPTNVINGLEDILFECQRGREHWQRAMERAERNMDSTMVLSLARLRDSLAEIERKAKDARQGRYVDDGGAA